MSKILFIFSLIFLSVPAYAQDCRTDYELIFDLKDGKLGSYNIWDAVYGGRESEERFTSAVPAEGSHNVAAGLFFEKPADPPQLLLVRLDYRGREVWKQTHKIEDLEAVVKILPHDKGYMVLGNTYNSKKRASVWFGFFDAEGALLRKASIKGAGDLRAHDIVPARDGKGFLLATSLKPSGQKTRTVLYNLNSKAGVIKDRAYMPGLENAILGLSPSGEDQYLAQGYVESADGRLAGWVMKLNADGSLVWQQQYKRGSSARLIGAYDYNENYVVVVGRADPAGTGNGLSAGWVMMINEFDGEVAWQRYYTGSYNYEARDVLVSEDGLISVLLNGDADADQNKMREEEGEEPKLDYVSLLTINPRGTLLIRDAYYNGEGSDAAQMYFGPRRERIMVGHTDMKYKIEAVADMPETEISSIEGWLIAAEETDPYSDPCVR